MTDYIRGAGAGDVSGRRVARVVLVGIIVILAILVIVLAMQAINDNSRADRLKRHGVAVTVTVTRCLGLASGTGITVNGYDCRGTFTLGGHRYESLIGGSTQLLPVGQQLTAITDPAHPATLSTVAAAESTRSDWKAFIPAAIALISLFLVALVALIAKRSRPG